MAYRARTAEHAPKTSAAVGTMGEKKYHRPSSLWRHETPADDSSGSYE